MRFVERWVKWLSLQLSPRKVTLEMVFDAAVLPVARSFYSQWCEQKTRFEFRLGVGQPADKFDPEIDADWQEFYLTYPPIEQDAYWILGDDGEDTMIVMDKRSGNVCVQTDLSIVGEPPYVEVVADDFAEFLSRINWSAQLSRFNSHPT